MKTILKEAWNKDPKALVAILILNVAVALTGSVSTVMLVPMLDLLKIDLDSQGLGRLLAPFSALPYEQRAGVLIGLFVALILARAVLVNWGSVRQNRFFEGYELSLRRDLYQAVSHTDWETLSRKKHSQLYNLLLTQCRQARVCLQNILSLVASATSALLQLAIAFWLSPALTALVLAAGLGFLVLFRPFQRRSRQCGQEAVEITQALFREVHNQLDSVKEARTYGVEGESARLFDRAVEEYRDVHLRATQLRVVPQFCYSAAAAVLIALAFLVSLFWLRVDVARIVILVYIFSRLWPMFASWQSKLQSIQSCLPAFETIREARDTMPPEDTRPCQDHPISFEKELAFRHVGFAYSDGAEQVLEDVSFTLPFGSVTALVGRSGTGKSTAADLLLGLLKPTQGCVTVDGVPLGPENVQSWRKLLGYVPQDPLIMDTTIRENLRRFHPEATEEQMIHALKQAQAWPFVEKLDRGLDTVLGAKGLGLSGGEKQRIVLARVFLGNPRLIILDEATSALDHESEALIRQTIQSLKGKTTVLIIAHRLATIRTADRAIVLDRGHVAESGPLEDLLTKETGYLAEMVSIE